MPSSQSPLKHTGVGLRRMIVPLCPYDADQYKAIREQDTLLAGTPLLPALRCIETCAAAIQKSSADQ